MSVYPSPHSPAGQKAQLPFKMVVSENLTLPASAVRAVLVSRENMPLGPLIPRIMRTSMLDGVLT
jgi:hypothetical protein